MSAFIVDTDHIDLLTSAMVERQITAYVTEDDNGYTKHIAHKVDYMSADETGRLLLLENIESVGYRYPADTYDEMPGPIDKTQPEDYRHRMILTGGPDLGPVALLKAIDCYTYQSCEHPGWESSMAHALCKALQSRLIGELPGYSTANTWDYERPANAPQVVSLLDVARGRA